MSKFWIFCVFLLFNSKLSIASTNTSIEVLMTHCCDIGSHLNDCSEEGIEKSILNPPIGLCRSTIKFCCELTKIPRNCVRNFHEQFDRRCQGKSNDPTACCEACKIGKYLSALNHTCDSFPLNISTATSHLITKCCATATRRVIRKNSNNISCKLGYKWNRKLSKCEDIDECRIVNNGCYEETQKCENTIGSYRCVPREICRDGFELDDETMECRELRTMTHSFDKNCPNGFRLDNSTGSCEDIDECAENSSLCSQLCVNLKGKFKCLCRRGYRMIDDKCVDIDECKEANVCSHQCRNVKGSFKCKCPNGLRIGKNQRTCEDINECEENEGICGKKPCRNFFGGYSCDACVDCPKHFKPHPTVGGRNVTKCVRKPCDIKACKLLPKYWTFKALSLPLNMTLPAPIFNIKTKSLKFDVDFKMTLKVLPKLDNIKTASIGDFSIKKQPTRSLVMLVKSLQAPQTVTLEIDMINKQNRKLMETIQLKINI